jgi:hypothetical protein
MAGDEFVVERLRRPSDPDDEREIEEQLERCRGAVLLVAVTHDGAAAQPAEVDGRSATHGAIVRVPVDAPMSLRLGDRRNVNVFERPQGDSCAQA